MGPSISEKSIGNEDEWFYQGHTKQTTLDNRLNLMPYFSNDPNNKNNLSLSLRWVKAFKPKLLFTLYLYLFVFWGIQKHSHVHANIQIEDENIQLTLLRHLHEENPHIFPSYDIDHNGISLTDPMFEIDENNFDYLVIPSPNKDGERSKKLRENSSKKRKKRDLEVQIIPDPNQVILPDNIYQYLKQEERNKLNLSSSGANNDDDEYLMHQLHPDSIASNQDLPKKFIYEYHQQQQQRSNNNNKGRPLDHLNPNMNIGDSIVYQPDLNQNLHSYTNLRRQKPLGFKAELKGRKAKSMKQQHNKQPSSSMTQHPPTSQRVNIKIFDKDFNLTLHQNDKLVGPNFIYALRNGSQVKQLAVRVPSCYYKGYNSNANSNSNNKLPSSSINDNIAVQQNGNGGNLFFDGQNSEALSINVQNQSFIFPVDAQLDIINNDGTTEHMAALSTCRGELRGYVRDDKDGSHYYIHPMNPQIIHRTKRSLKNIYYKLNSTNSSMAQNPSRKLFSPFPNQHHKNIHAFLRNTIRPHIVIKLANFIKHPSDDDHHESSARSYCPLDHFTHHQDHIVDPLNFRKTILESPRHNRVRRAPEDNAPELETDATVEIGLFYDEDLYMQTQMASNREEKIMDYVLNIMNAVGLLLTHPSLGKSLDVSLVRLEIFEKQPDSLKTKDATALLEAFREFQMDSNPAYELANSKNWDNAILLTGMNMYQNIYANGQLQKVQSIAGLAGIGTMCHNKFSASIIEAKGYRSAYSIAHEMGHNFGMVHDGVSYASRCENEGYIMSPHTGMGTNKWSECSREIISDTLKYFTCLYETSDTPWKLSFPVQNVLPGQRISADQQCEAFVGKGSKRFKGTQIETICYYLWCTQPNNDYFAYGTHPALDGTYCGWNKWCRAGTCTNWPYNHGSEVVNGGWTPWVEDTGCSYNCMVDGSGVYLWSRKCENPYPLNGGDECYGENVAYELCDPDAHVFDSCHKISVQDFIDDTCSKKSTQAIPYIGGSQYTHNEKVPTHACHVYCQRADTGEYVPSGLLPDGSLCHIDDDGLAFYCVHGMCNKPISGAHELPY